METFALIGVADNPNNLRYCRCLGVKLSKLNLPAAFEDDRIGGKTKAYSQSVENCHRLKPETVDSKKCGGIAKKARKELEAKTGRNVVSKENFLPPSANAKKLGREK